MSVTEWLGEALLDSKSRLWDTSAVDADVILYK